MKRLSGKIILELIGGALAMTGAGVAAISSSSDKLRIGVYIGIACIFLGWAAFTVSQLEEK
jgi:hypothetical protein